MINRTNERGRAVNSTTRWTRSLRRGLPAGPRSVLWVRLRDDAGMTTAEYAVGTLAAVAFAGLLLKVVTSDAVHRALAAVIEKALG